MNTLANTTLNLGLLSTPVKVYNARTKDEIEFSTCGPEGETLERVYRVKSSEEVIAHVDLAKRFGGKLISKSALEAAEQASLFDEEGNDLRQINVESFIPLKDIPFFRADSHYYVGPNIKVGSAQPLETLKLAMKRRKVAALAKFVFKSRQKLLVLWVEDDILCAASLTFAACVVAPERDDLIKEVKVNKAEAKVMGELIDAHLSHAATIDHTADTFVARKRELIESAIEGEEMEAPEPQPHATENLLEALEKSVENAKVKS